MYYLYHYTSFLNMRDIIASGKLALTPSNLKPPKNMRMGMNDFGRMAYGFSITELLGVS